MLRTTSVSLTCNLGLQLRDLLLALQRRIIDTPVCTSLNHRDILQRATHIDIRFLVFTRQLWIDNILVTYFEPE